ncbi:hypothetical protein BH23DEI1_BH23DEI1_10630 [soil metagenome]|nr:hypothetical protein [Trueperaceae bacterium]
MRPIVTLGLVLVIAGALAMILQLAGVFNESAGIDLGVAAIEIERERNLPWLPWVAGTAILVGAVLMISGRRA